MNIKNEKKDRTIRLTNKEDGELLCFGPGDLIRVNGEEHGPAMNGEIIDSLQIWMDGALGDVIFNTTDTNGKEVEAMKVTAQGEIFIRGQEYKGMGSFTMGGRNLVGLLFNMRLHMCMNSPQTIWGQDV